jgi:hypothetical protein
VVVQSLVLERDQSTDPVGGLVDGADGEVQVGGDLGGGERGLEAVSGLEIGHESRLSGEGFFIKSRRGNHQSITAADRGELGLFPYVGRLGLALVVVGRGQLRVECDGPVG